MVLPRLGQHSLPLSSFGFVKMQRVFLLHCCHHLKRILCPRETFLFLLSSTLFLVKAFFIFWLVSRLAFVFNTRPCAVTEPLKLESYLMDSLVSSFFLPSSWYLVVCKAPGGYLSKRYMSFLEPETQVCFKNSESLFVIINTVPYYF